MTRPSMRTEHAVAGADSVLYAALVTLGDGDYAEGRAGVVLQAQARANDAAHAEKTTCGRLVEEHEVDGITHYDCPVHGCVVHVYGYPDRCEEPADLTACEQCDLHPEKHVVALVANVEARLCPTYRVYQKPRGSSA